MDKLEYIFDNAKEDIAVGNAQDNTNVKRNDDDIVKITRQLTSLVSTIPDLLWVKDINGVYLTCNPAYERFINASKSDIIGKTDYDFYEANAADACKQSDLDAIAADSVTLSYETFFDHNTGEDSTWEVRKVSVTMPGGESMGVLGIGRDITQQKQMEASLHDANERYTHILDNSIDPIYLLEVTEDGRFIHIEINQAFLDATGVPKEKIVGQYVDEIENEGFREILLRKYGSCLAAGVKTEFTAEYDLPDGLKTYHSILTPIRDESGRIEKISGIARDITEQKKAELALIESQTKLQTIIENEPECIKIIDANGHLVYMNPAGLDMIEATLDQVQGKAVLGVVVEEYRNSFAQMHQRVIAGEKVNLIFETIGLKGKHCWLETTSAPMQLNGEPVLLGVTRDITDRINNEKELKKNEEALKIREQEFRSLAENSTDPIFRYDLDCRRIYVNPTVERLSGIPASALLGKTPSEATTVPTKEALKIEETIKRVIQTGEPEILDVLFVAPDGKEHYFRNNHIPEFDSDGTITSVLAISHDITAVKQQEGLLETIRKSEQKLNNLYALSPLGIALTDMNGKYIEFNDAFCTICGYTLDELKELDYWALTPIEYKEQEREQLELLKRTGRYGPYEKVYRQKNGNLIPIQLNGVLFTGDDGEQYIWSIVEDITERKRAEETINSKSILLQSILESSPDVTMFALDTGYNYLTFNQNHRAVINEIWGHNITIGMNMLDYITREDDRQKSKEFFDKALGGESFVNESEYGDENFSRSYWETYYSPMYDDNGETIGLTCFNLNITERKEQEELLRQKEAEFRSLAERTPDTIARYDRDCIRTYANPSLASMMGIATEELLGEKPTAYNFSVQSVAYEDKMSEVMQNGFEGEFEYTWPDKTGQMITSHVRIIPEKDENGVICSVLAIGRDITSIKAYEQRLKHNEDRLIKAQKVAKIGSLEVEFPGLKIALSSETLNIFEIDSKVSAFSYDHILDVVHPEDRVAVDAQLGVAIANKTPYEIVHRLLFRDGRIKYVEQKWETVFDKSGTPIRSIGTVQDITQRKQQELLLKEKENEYQTLANNYPDIIIRYDRSCRRVYVNYNFKKIFSYVANEFLGKSPIEGSGLVAPQYFMDEVKKVINSGLSSEIEIAAINIQNEMRWYLATLVPEFDGNEVSGVLCVARDISDSKVYESALQKSAKLQKTLSRMAGSIPGFVFVFKRSLIDKMTFTYVSSGIMALCGLHPEELADDAMPFFSLIHPDDRHKIDNAISISAINMSPLYEQLRIYVPGGEIMWLEVKATPKIDTDNDGIAWYGVVQDITQRIQQERKLSMMEYFLDHINEELFLMRNKGEFEYINEAACRTLGYSREELNGMGVGDIDPDYQPQRWDEHWEYIKENTSQLLETSHTTKEGKVIPVEIHANYFEYDDTGYNLAITHDITQRKENEAKLKRKEERLKEAQRIAKMGSWDWDIGMDHIEWSDMAYEIYTPDKHPTEIGFEDFASSIHTDDRERVSAAVNSALEHGTPFNVEHRIVSDSKGVCIVHAQGEVFRDVNGKPVRMIGTVQDITEQKNVEKKIEYMAHHDPLTNLPNRIVAKERADHAISFAKRNETKVALLFIDLDGFKTINDTLGHSAGDTMLKIIASRLHEVIRETDTLSRQGGDEFLLIMSDITDGSKDITTIANKILRELEKPFNIGGHSLSSSASIGIACYPDHGESFEALLQSADTAMYKAKETGKNTFCFYDAQMNHRLMHQFKIQNDLKGALKKSEFILYYQPQIDLGENQIIGAEALIRWNHPELGMVAPMDFIPVAESSGLIVQIGQWVIEEACRQAALWHQMGIKITIAVNISSIQFKRGNLVAIVENALASSGIDPQYLELEITESVMMHDINDTLKAVQQLKALGVKLSIDDFGTGYSSLAYLKRFAVDKLKIDQSFIKDIVDDQEDAAIVSAIIQMAKSLNLKTIAEGVENSDVLSLIDGFGCDQVQGYHYAKPLESADFEHYYTHLHTLSENT